MIGEEGAVGNSKPVSQLQLAMEFPGAAVLALPSKVIVSLMQSRTVSPMEANDAVGGVGQSWSIAELAQTNWTKTVTGRNVRAMILGYRTMIRCTTF